MPLKGVVVLLKRTRAIPFSRDLLHFVRLRSQPYTSSVTISGRTPQPRSHGPSFLFMPPGGEGGRVGDLDPGNQLFVFKGQSRTKLFLK